MHHSINYSQLADCSLLLLSAAYLPPVSWMALADHCSQISIEMYETYPKQTWRNRCRIMTANGLQDLSIPVKKPSGNHTLTKDVLVSDHSAWQMNHWRSIVSAYQKSPYFIHYAPLIEPLYLQVFSGTLVEWNDRLLRILAEEMGLCIELSKTYGYEKNPGKSIDLRNNFTPKQVWPPLNTGFSWPQYHQVFADKHGFMANLSIIDLLFNQGTDAKYYLKRCASAFTGQSGEG